jgi:modulator of FtsH protease HflK
MARGESDTDERVRRGAARTVANVLAVLVLFAGMGFWASLGFYRLDPGEAAVVLQLGRYQGTEAREGLRWHLPPPIERHDIVTVGAVSREEFGAPRGDDSAAMSERAMQTGDNNIVHLDFVVQYRIGRAFEARYRIAELRQTLRDSAQAAMREVVGRSTIDGVLAEGRGAVEADAAELLQAILDGYEAGIFIQGVQLQEVQPPDPVRAAFDDVIAAAQDRSRAINEAEGYANEVLPRARAEAQEEIEQAVAYRDTKIAAAEGEAERFLALLAEYEKAPAITRKRLYLETMEDVLPGVEKVLVQPGTAPVLPYLPIGRPERGERP